MMSGGRSSGHSLTGEGWPVADRRGRHDRPLSAHERLSSPGPGPGRRRGLERDLAQFTVVQPDDRLMAICADLRASCEHAGHGLGQKVHEADPVDRRHSAIRLDADLVSDDAIFQAVLGLRVLRSI